MNRLIISTLLILSITSGYGQYLKDKEGALIRSDTLNKTIYLCFTGHDFYEGFEHTLRVLKKHNIPGSFFLTGEFIKNHKQLVIEISKQGHYIGAHSDKHLLYCDWSDRNLLLVPEKQIKKDIIRNLKKLRRLDIRSTHFMPPYEWYNKKVVEIASELNQVTINFSPGTRSNADYTTPDMSNYISSQKILESIYEYEQLNNLNGFHLLIHPGIDSKRKDKLYLHLDSLIANLKNKGYQFSKF